MNFFRMLFLAVLSWAALTSPVHAVGASFSQTDVTNLNNAEPPSKYNRTFGYRHGGGRCTFDPSANTSQRTIAAHQCGLTVPKNAVVTFAAYKVLTTFTSATDAATIAVKIVSANDVVSAVAISTGTTWDADVAIETIPKVETSSTWLTTTADSPVTFTVATEALTAGKLVLWVYWMYYGDL
jgi:hypothetical protein